VTKAPADTYLHCSSFNSMVIGEPMINYMVIGEPMMLRANREKIFNQ
jgi:hypothetical protein